MNRITPEHIEELKVTEVFVFGSNEDGIHNDDNSKLAHQKWKALWGYGVGMLSQQTYGIPTKKNPNVVLPLEKIKKYVDDFVIFAKMNQSKHFYVTKIGCESNNYDPKDIAPLFKNAVDIKNISFPQCFWDILNYK